MATLLLIEDNNDVRENIEEILLLAGYKVLTAQNGKEGVEIAAKQSPDLIVCDIMMPELDGYGVLHLLNKSPKTSHIPFIFLTAKAERTDFRKGMEMGADDYITKPFEDIELLNAIEIRLKKAEVLNGDITFDQEGISQFFENAERAAKIKLTGPERELQHFRKKQILYQHGSRPTALYFVQSGMIKTYKMNDEGKELITGIFKKGDFYGYNALLEDTIYQDFAECLEDCEVMLIPKADFLQLLGSDSQVARKFIRLLSRDIAEHEEKLLNLAYNSLRKRVAIGLVKVNEKFKKAPEDKPRLEISREDLAQVVGTATESLIRTLSDFKSERLIDINDGKIVVVNEPKLKNLLN